MSENIDPKAKQEFLTMIGHSLEVLEGGLISDVNRQSIRNGILEAISNLMDQRDAANARAEKAEAELARLKNLLIAWNLEPDGTYNQPAYWALNSEASKLAWEAYELAQEGGEE